jgi:hypothetical protein
MKYLIILGLSLCMTTGAIAQQKQLPMSQQATLQVAVWDTYVTRKDGRVMHFDILAPADMRDTAVIHGYGRHYLASKGEGGQRLTAKECRFCHVRQTTPVWEAAIRKQGYYILELENCD